ncbi:MAG: serine/threonine-protein kinase [Candidatus Solibacter usitatus]|nr:serine/threonine-protein kinase [Candidatus Solibacter usitatus]
MPLSAGAKLGPYEIVSTLGAGGMGEVYRAKDTQLDRHVAIKVLHDALAQDPDRLARFSREAKVLASLNHPHIAQIYGIEGRALVMELVPGETLRGPIPLATALEYAKQIAEALEAAHEKGIVHRDLKPGNVMVTPEGAVKVLDFGLAAVGQEPVSSGADPANSPTLTMRATQAGMIMGTAAYMSPEQAAGKPVDKRSDIWSFGVVLFEILTGQRLFEGETISHTLADVLKGQIGFSRLPQETPRPVRDLLLRCLDRDVKTRLRDIGEARIAIQGCLVHPESAMEVPPQGNVRPARLPWAVAALCAIAAGFAFWSAHRGGSTPAQVERLSIDLPDADPLPWDIGGHLFAISPDGSRLVYTSRHGDTTRLCLRRLDQFEIKPLAGTEGGLYPFFSPDGRWLGFAADGKLKKIPVDGGSPTVICDSGPLPTGASWNPDNSITFSPGFTFGIARVPADGGKAEVFLKPDAAKNESSYLWPQVLPDSILFTVGPDSIASFNEAQIFLAPRGRSGAKTLIAGGACARYLPTGHLVYAYDGRLLAAPFDPAQGKLQGPALPVVEGVQMAASDGTAQYAVSQTGTLAYLAGRMSEGRSRIVMVARNGSEEKNFDVKLAVGEMRLSPDGQRLALRTFKANDDIHILDLNSGTAPRFTFEGGDEQSPVWTPDGSRVAYGSARGAPSSIYWKAADGSGTPQLLTKAENPRYPSAISPDGKVLIFTEQHPATGSDLWLMPLEDGGTMQPKAWIRTPFHEDKPAFSPDGRWVAYASNESGEAQVFVAQFPEGSVRRQISTSGGTEPLWASNGKEIFYRKPKGDGDVMEVMAVDVVTQPSFGAGSPHLLFERKYQPATGLLAATYAVTPDGQHFILLKPAIGEPVRQIQVVLHWFEDLKHRIPAGAR